MDKIVEDDIEEIKKKLKVYSKDQIEFNEPHFTQSLLLRNGNRCDVIKLILCPDNLVYSYQEPGIYGDIKHNLYFRISNNRTIKLPVIFDRNYEKSLYILTYILRYRSWQNLVRRG